VGLADQGRADTASTFLLPHHPVTDVRDGAWIDQGPGPPGTLGRGHPQQAHGPASAFGQPDPRTRAAEGTSGDLTGLFGGVGLQEHPTEVLLVAVLVHQQADDLGQVVAVGQADGDITRGQRGRYRATSRTCRLTRAAGSEPVAVGRSSSWSRQLVSRESSARPGSGRPMTGVSQCWSGTPQIRPTSPGWYQV